jgi:phosphoglycerate dehydrogenase-like enzyme
MHAVALALIAPIHMTGILISDQFTAANRARAEAIAHSHGQSIKWLVLPEDPQARLDEASIAKIDIAFYTIDIMENRGRSFFSAVRKAQRLRWLHTYNVGIDHPIFAEMLAKGIRLTASAGTTAVPIAQTTITALLMLARGFPYWLQSQREHAWRQVRGDAQPDDLKGQTLCILGLGSIGTEIARLALALSMRVVGIRRSPHRPEDIVAEIHPPAALGKVLERSQWLAVTCPLTDETRRLIDADMLARMPRGAKILNVGRGEVIDEADLVAALQSGQIGGAYLDVFEKEPLPADSPLWDMPNVIVTPHNSTSSSGNIARIQTLFVENLARWFSNEPLKNEAKA